MHFWDSGTKAWIDPRTLAQRQAAKWEDIKAHRESLESGNFTWQGSTFQINKQNITGAALDALLAKQAGENFQQPWVLADNSRIMLTADQMIAVGRAMKAYVSNLSVTSETLRDQIYADSTTTQSQLDSITWPS